MAVYASDPCQLSGAILVRDSKRASLRRCVASEGVPRWSRIVSEIHGSRLVSGGREVRQLQLRLFLSLPVRGAADQRGLPGHRGRYGSTGAISANCSSTDLKPFFSTPGRARSTTAMAACRRSSTSAPTLPSERRCRRSSTAKRPGKALPIGGCSARCRARCTRPCSDRSISKSMSTAAPPGRAFRDCSRPWERRSGVQVSGDRHRVRIDLPDGIEFEIAEIGSGSTKAAAALALALNDSYGQFNRFHLSGDGIVRGASGNRSPRRA